MWDKRHQKQSFVRSGVIRFDIGVVKSFGSNGRNWSNTINDYYSYNLELDIQNINPSNITSRYNGFSVRCLVILIGINTTGASGCIV